jgi:hypothetical protein
MNASPSYDVALSFAGEDRQCAEELAYALKRHGVEVFYDYFEEAKLWGKDLYVYLSDLYQNQARYCVMFLSKQYALKAWTNHERRAAQARAFQENEEYILPVRLDATEIPGILPTIGYLSWQANGAEGIAQKLLEKLGRASTSQHLPTPSASAGTTRQAASLSVDEAALLTRARTHIPSGRNASHPSLCVVVAGGPAQRVLRPSELDAPALRQTLAREANYGAFPIFDPSKGTNTGIKDGVLVIEQEQASLFLNARGDIRILQGVLQTERQPRLALPAIIEEEIEERIGRAIHFADLVLGQIDTASSLTDVVVIAALLNAGYLGWRTRAEQAASPQSMSHSLMRSGSEQPIVYLEPALMARSALAATAGELAKDLTVLLRQRLRPGS